MALQKTKNLANGSEGNYWKITSISIDRISGEATYVISLFKDKVHSDAKTPNMGISHTVKGTPLSILKELDIIQCGYNLVNQKALIAPTPLSSPKDREFYSDFHNALDV